MFPFRWPLHNSLEIALTIEPQKDQEEGLVNPRGKLKAHQIVNGYMLPDPDEANRLTVWFTGGKLVPATPPSRKSNDESEKGQDQSVSEEYADFDEWKRVFEDSHKTTTWSESLKKMGVKLLLGAELPQSMESDGTFSYTFSRPYGGHGKGYVDILYIDRDLYVTRGNSGTIHVAIRSELFSTDPDPQSETVERTTTGAKTAKTRDDIPISVPSSQKAAKKPTSILRPSTLSATQTQAEKAAAKKAGKSVVIASSDSSVSSKRKASSAVEEELTDDPAAEDDQNATIPQEDDNDDESSACYGQWKEYLRRDLGRNPDEVTTDLRDILASYGYAVVQSTKRSKTH